MKFIHCADLHIDSKIEKLSPDKSAIRREEVLNAFERMVDFAVENKVSAVIISGDMFDVQKITKRSLNRILSAINKASSMDFLYLCGNHDQLTQAFNKDMPSNFKMFSNEFTAFRYANVVIGGIDVSNNASNSIYDQINFEKNDFNILCMHGQIADFKSKETVDIISLPLLRDKNIDYLALGHYHTYSTGRIDQRGIFAYSGCLEGRGFDELGDKGFILIDTEKDDYIEFVKFSKRSYNIFNFNLSEYLDYPYARSELLSLLPNTFSKEDIVRVVLKGEIDANFYIDHRELENRLGEYFFYAEVEDKTVLSIKEEDYLLDKTAKGEFLRLVWESDLSQEEKKKIISCGLNALRGEELLWNY